jgi:dTDP-4-dehydrorhamnose 3,5-epimerase
MKFTPLKVQGAYLIELEKREDHRGFFARAFCAREFEQHGLVARVSQYNVPFNDKADTIRGLHYQTAPAPEAKLIRCIDGSIFDVIVDLRPDSPTFMHWCGTTPTAESFQAVYVSEFCLQGYQALTDRAAVLMTSASFTPRRRSVAIAPTIPRSTLSGRCRFKSSPKRRSRGSRVTKKSFCHSSISSRRRKHDHR